MPNRGLIEATYIGRLPPRPAASRSSTTVPTNMNPAHLSFNFTPSPEPKSRQVGGGVIDGVEFRRLKMNVDYRGCFTEVFQDYWKTCIKPVQWSVVHSLPNVFRGVHLHRRHDEYISVMHGHASVGLRDLRPWSATKGNWALYELHGDELACLTFPLGLLHGWYFHTATIHLQSVSESYLDYGAEDNWGCHWSDPGLEIPWPCTDPIVAKRAADFPSMDALITALGDWGPPQGQR